MVVMIAGLSAGLFAAKNIEILGRLTEPAVVPSDDEIYTGSILFVPDDEGICRQLLFDNRTGRFTDNGLVDCDRAYNEEVGMSGRTMHWSSMRAKIISEAFRNH